ncbi:DUF378 domain-containing protein [Halomarina halobia]|uniref:DUF378 domain-containing protein n=1 Tax=Halomarina halobia TaxID=3033386 RepID=A0ABD6A601_9EURY|nr:DUF378 domain-containing protein [Halomarina sp. PSR21]
MKYEGQIRASPVDWASLALVIVGALVWGLVGLGMFVEANWNVVNVLLGSVPTVEALVYLLVGLAGLYELYFAYQLYGARSAEMSAKEKTA